jgi:hypothetical protein
MRLSKFTAGSIAILFVLPVSSAPADAAYGFCMAPRAPSVFLSKPTKPFCAASRSCEQWQVTSYKNEVEQYFNSLKTYLEDVDKYQKKAYEYAECMADLD